MKMVTITTEYIKLQDLLKLADAVATGGEAKIRVQEGEVLVNGAACTHGAGLIRPNEPRDGHGRSPGGRPADQ